MEPRLSPEDALLQGPLQRQLFGPFVFRLQQRDLLSWVNPRKGASTGGSVSSNKHGFRMSLSDLTDLMKQKLSKTGQLPTEKWVLSTRTGIWGNKTETQPMKMGS